MLVLPWHQRHQRVSNFPRLAGQQKTYIVNQLRTFQDRSRADPRAHVYMWGMAANLRDPMIDKIAADYAAMAPAPGMPGDPADTDAGRAIYMNGIVDHGVPACIRSMVVKRGGLTPIRDWQDSIVTTWSDN